MSDIPLNENIDLSLRKEQALQLDIDLPHDMTLEYIEKEITNKLENGMKELKNIVNDISTLEFELN